MANYVVNVAGQTATNNAPKSDSPASAYGKIVLDGTALTATSYLAIPVGFTPRYVCFENVTDSIKIEWYEGMAEDTCIKTLLNGTRSLQVNDGIAIVDLQTTTGGVSNANGRTILITQDGTVAVVLASKTYVWHARS